MISCSELPRQSPIELCASGSRVPLITTEEIIPLVRLLIGHRSPVLSAIAGATFQLVVKYQVSMTRTIDYVERRQSTLGNKSYEPMFSDTTRRRYARSRVLFVFKNGHSIFSTTVFSKPALYKNSARSQSSDLRYIGVPWNMLRILTRVSVFIASCAFLVHRLK